MIPLLAIVALMVTKTASLLGTALLSDSDPADTSFLLDTSTAHSSAFESILPCLAMGMFLAFILSYHYRCDCAPAMSSIPSNGDVVPHTGEQSSPDSLVSISSRGASTRLSPPSTAPPQVRSPSARRHMAQSSSSPAMSPKVYGCPEECREVGQAPERRPAPRRLSRPLESCALPDFFVTLGKLFHRGPCVSTTVSRHRDKRHPVNYPCQHCWQYAQVPRPATVTAFPVHWDGGRGLWERQAYDPLASPQQWPRRVGPSAAAMDLPGVRAAWGLPVDGVPASASAESRHLASSSSLERGVRPAAPEMMAETQRRARMLANDVFVGTRGNDLSSDLNAAADTSHYPDHPSVEAQGYDGDDDQEVVGADDSGYAERDSTGSGSQEGSTDRDSEASPESKPRRKTARGCRSGKKVKEKREQRRQEEDRRRLLARRALLERQLVLDMVYPSAPLHCILSHVRSHLTGQVPRINRLSRPISHPS
ncbi:hypothetical protein I350_00249 [Cryptococcus amylolentus CBS 6273]|uniref:BZIP domain-containing protein n=1 Tax=Cryptococcus amylolentus CBS 6273 TaxID=1296118 RepID=A0A1E3KEF6_9TREE|nr:hypothetical protein I350_00249 [Cryptococcus amylolentus CBS 6273]